jgi:hypothetical protein
VPWRSLGDLSLLASLLILLAAGSFVAGFPSLDYLRFAAVFGLFLLPGWWLSATLLERAEVDSLLERLPLAFLIAYLVYGWLALACRAAGGSYEVFFALYAFAAAAAGWLAGRRGGAARWRRVLAAGRENAPVLLVLALALAFYTFPVSDDQGLWDFNILDSLETRSFAPSALDVRPFGLGEAQPRMQANLFHVFFALCGSVADVSPRVLVFYGATPFLGAFLLLALTALVARIAGPRVDRALALAAVIAPCTLLHQLPFVYWYEFRILNSPTLDKDFATFFLLPMLLWLAWRHLLEGRRRWLVLYLLGLPVAIWTHPVAPIYVLLGTGVLGAAAVSRERLRRVLALALAAVAAVALCTVAIDPAETHPAIQELVAIDLETNSLHFWPGHYGVPGHEGESSIMYTPEGHPLLKKRHFFGGALVAWSALPFPIWLALFLAGSRGRPRSRRLPLALGGGLVWAGFAMLFFGWIRVTPGLVPAAGASAAAGLLLLPIAAWAGEASRPGEASWEGSVDDAEVRALRVQCGFVGLLPLLYAGTALALRMDPALYRGLERLHWAYLGFFTLVFLARHAGRGVGLGVGALADRLAPTRSAATLRGGLALTPLALVSLHVADQASAMWRREPTLQSRLGLARSMVDDLNTPNSRRDRTFIPQSIRSEEGEQGARAALVRPPWLRDGDAIVHLHARPFYYQLIPYKLALAKHSVYYRELYSEAFAYQHLGDEFLRRFRAYNDAVDGRISPRLLDWLREQRVTVIATRTPRFLARLAPHWEHPIELIETRMGTFLYRIGEPAQAAPRPRAPKRRRRGKAACGSPSRRARWTRGPRESPLHASPHAWRLPEARQLTPT